MPRVLPPTARRTLVVFATFSGLLLSMAQSCETGCGPSSGASPRATVDDSSGGQYFRDRAQGYDGTGSARVTNTRTSNDRTCTPGTRPTTTKTTTKRPGNTHDDDRSGNNGSAFDEGYDKGYDEGYDEGYDDGRDDSRRKDTDGDQDDDDR